ncbi:MAG: serine hydrolase [Hyphomicrobiaceae bacterium]
MRVKHPQDDAMIDMATFLEQTNTDAFVFVRGDTIVHKKFFNGMHANHRHRMMSVTKSFSGLLGLMAVDDGKLKDEAPVVQYVPELKKATAFAYAAFGQVLDMTNSMNFTEDYADPRSGIRRYGAVIGWTPRVPDIQYEANLYDNLCALPIDKMVSSIPRVSGVVALNGGSDKPKRTTAEISALKLREQQITPQPQLPQLMHCRI